MTFYKLAFITGFLLFSNGSFAENMCDSDDSDCGIQVESYSFHNDCYGDDFNSYNLREPRIEKIKEELKALESNQDNYRLERLNDTNDAFSGNIRSLKH